MSKSDRRVVGLARDLVDLVDVDDPGLGLFDVEVGRLNQLEQDVLDVLAHITGLGQRGRIGDGEGHIENAGERLRQQRLSATGRAEQQDVRFLQLDVGFLDDHLHALVVVVYRYSQRSLRFLLAYDVVVENAVDLFGLGQVLQIERGWNGELFVDDLVAEIYALVADVDTRACDEFLDLPLGLAAEATEELLVSVACPSHFYSL